MFGNSPNQRMMGKGTHHFHMALHAVRSFKFFKAIFTDGEITEVGVLLPAPFYVVGDVLHRLDIVHD